MRVGFVCDNASPDAGGGYTVQTSIERAIRSRGGQHNFIKLNWPELRGETSAREVLDSAICDLGLDMAWFLTPMAAPVCVPFLATVWDLEHRRLPFFPEVSIEGWWTWEKREETYRATLPRAARVLTGTETGRDEIIQFYSVPPENVRIVPLPLPHFASPQSNSAPILAKYNLPEIYLFYPAQFWPHKNHINLLMALEHLKTNHALSLPLVLTGSDKGNLAHVEALIRRQGLTSQVHILGFVPEEDLIQLYRGAVALVFPTFFGPDNLPPLEAFSLGCPVIASRVPGAEEQLGDAALLFDPAEPSELAAAVATLVSDPKLRAQLIENGFEKVSARSSETYVRRVCQVIEELEPIRRCWPSGSAPASRKEIKDPTIESSVGASLRFGEGIGPLEGPYPKFGVQQLFRWCQGPSSLIDFDCARGGRYILFLEYLNPIHPQQLVTMSLDGADAKAFRLVQTSGTTSVAAKRMELTPGEHRVQLSFTHWVEPTPEETRRLAMMLTRCSLELVEPA
jgi:glycosyltransferase involved in cell wall biosynthesis